MLRKKMLLLGLLAVGCALSPAWLQPARADHGHRGGYYAAPGCNPGHAGHRMARRGYGVGYAPVGGYYVSPGLTLRSGVGLSYGPGFYGYHGNPYATGYYFGNPGFGLPYDRQTVPRVQLRIGF